MTSLKMAWIGLGVMGGPMAAHLAQKSGHSLTVYNRTAARAEAWVRQHSQAMAHTPAQAAQAADVVFSCVGNDEDLREVTLGAKGAFAAMQPGSLYVDHTTTSAIVARELHAAAKMRGIGFVDAPVSGGQAGAEKGTLTVMCGGEGQDYDRAEPLMRNYARMCKLLGAPGCGQLAKMTNQIAIAGLVQALSECIQFGIRAGLDMEAVISVISHGAAGSWQMENRHKTMIADTFDFGFAVDLMRKDLGICLDEARRNGARLPVAALVDQFYADIQAQGGGGLDTSSLMTRLKP